MSDVRRFTYNLGGAVEKSLKYALWAPGVGYMREYLRPLGLASDPEAVSKFSYDLDDAALFPSISSLLEHVVDGRVRGFVGFEIREIETRPGRAVYEDVGAIR